MSDQAITVINYSSPELNHLAAALAEKGLLRRYVRPYANQERIFERALAQSPGIKSLYRRTFGRRVMPEGFSSGDLCEVAIAPDILRAMMQYLPDTLYGRAEESLRLYMQKRIAAVGVKHVSDSRLVVANHHVAKAAFSRATGVHVLNFPIAHHRYIQRFVEEEADLEPAFAATLPNWSSRRSWKDSENALDAECEMADAILVGSTFVRDSFIAEGLPAEKMIVLPYGSDVSSFSPPKEDSKRTSAEFRLLFVGQIGQRKGVSYLLRAYESFRGPGTRLTLVGNVYGESRALMPFRHLFEHVPHVPKSDLAEQYRQADVFVFPTLLEGMGLVVLEAMASGLPVITTDNGPGDIVRDGIDGFIVPPRNADAIADKLTYLRHNRDVCREMGANARKRALEYSWDAYRNRGLEIMHGLMEGKTGGME